MHLCWTKDSCNILYSASYNAIVFVLYCRPIIRLVPLHCVIQTNYTTEFNEITALRHVATLQSYSVMTV